MPYTNNRVKIDTTTNPHTGVSINDVRTALLENTSDLGSLCTSNRINPMAKYKPVNYNTWGLTGRTSGSDYWKGIHGQCGLTIPSAFFSNHFAFMRSNNMGWSTETVTSKFRLLDFDGYDASEAVTFDDLKMPTGRIQETGPTIVFDNGVPVFHLIVGPQDNTGYFLKLSDITLYYSSSSNCKLEDMVPLMYILDINNSEYIIPLESSAQYLADREDDSLSLKTMKQIINEGITTLTFSGIYEFEFEPNLTTTIPEAGSIWSAGNCDFLIKESVGRPTLDRIDAILVSGNGNPPNSGTMSHDGSPSITYINCIKPAYTFGNKQYKIVPILYDAYNYTGLVCGLNTTPLVANLKSVTGVIEIKIYGCTRTSDTTFSVEYEIINGINSEQTVSLTYYTGSGLLPTQIDTSENETITYTIPACESVSGEQIITDTDLAGKQYVELDVYDSMFVFDGYTLIDMSQYIV